MFIQSSIWIILFNPHSVVCKVDTVIASFTNNNSDNKQYIVFYMFHELF